ncbi:MAG: hypothetical protein AMJ90_00760 [candidate division Zixibacteria bacterium SM23_73_2]|nr:MAG: hypothetical protein AMJ90_00760 [candidate division Zixibacteria bacterium SM23_73_2]
MSEVFERFLEPKSVLGVYLSVKRKVNLKIINKTSMMFERKSPYIKNPGSEVSSGTVPSQGHPWGD